MKQNEPNLVDKWANGVLFGLVIGKSGIHRLSDPAAMAIELSRVIYSELRAASDLARNACWN